MDIRYGILGSMPVENIFLGGSALGNAIGDIIAWLDDLVWGPWMLALLLGCGCYLMIRMDFFPIRNLKFALRCALGIEWKDRKNRGGTAGAGPDVSGTGAAKRPAGERLQGKSASGKAGKISSLSSLTTELATTLGIGNIVGVATAMTLGGPGALFWMVATSIVGLATKLAESMLAVKYRGRNDRGEIAGGPMYTCLHGFPNRKIGRMLGFLFALFAVTASFGMGNMTQSNSIADALWVAFAVPKAKTGLILTVLTVLVVIGGIGVIGKVTQVLVPFMGVFYLCGAFAVILVHWRNVPMAVGGIMTAAFCPEAVSGGIFGSVTVSAFQSLRWGVSRGIFSNEAGIGASGITAAAADTDDYIKQGCISMTGVFLDTVVVCTITGLAFAVSGMLGSMDVNGNPLTGTAMTLAAFGTVLGEWGGSFVSICIALFAFATVIGWAYQGEKAFEFLLGGKTRYNLWYRFAYGLAVFLGCICPLETVWNFSDICNGLMAVPNLICVLALSGRACREIREYPVPGAVRKPGDSR
ncbi:alanine/glycine:cation symporter family protein [Acetatifactor aquisgranensis]|uniref:alanine/glycine:cation symporter family protein n=1 Tax=Acetatifactor aquisgranensis TaxID=2941233 RepID=UPI0020403012|nr:amino acid carrier protein [Acetatifactor aquisgranensis]